MMQNMKFRNRMDTELRSAARAVRGSGRGYHSVVVSDAGQMLRA
jgi:hypothetical protein